MGCYYPNRDMIVVYLRPDPYSEVYPYRTLLSTALHETVHCMQWRDPLYVRYKGVMHDSKFYEKYNYFSQFIEEVSKSHEQS